MGCLGYYLGTKRIEQPTVDFSHHVIVPTAAISLTPSPDLTTNWKTYNNDMYHFSIKYPVELLGPKVETSSDGSYAITFTANGGPLANTFSIIILPNPHQLSVMDYINTIAFKGDLPGWDNAKRAQKIMIGSSEAVRIEKVIGGAGQTGPIVYIPDGTSIIAISTRYLSTTNEQIYNQVLSTFTYN